MGINESYHQSSSQILMMDPLPIINYAYSMIIEDESQKTVVTSTSSIGMTFVVLDSLAAMYSKVGSSSGIYESEV